jgi:hypothetical protein
VVDRPGRPVGRNYVVEAVRKETAQVQLLQLRDWQSS